MLNISPIELPVAQVKPKGDWTGCHHCGGAGLKLTYGEADECPACGGSGRLWKYPSGSLVGYPGGPFVS